jgi:CubicO group peptidase (beta-lactamase class C family)
VAVSLHGHRYFFSYGTATDGGAPFTRETLLEIGSCTKTFTTTLFALAINRNQIVPDASAQKCMPSGYTLRAQQADTAGAGRLHLGNAGRPDRPAARAPTPKHRVLHGERLSRLGFELRTEDPIACAL